MFVLATALLNARNVVMLGQIDESDAKNRAMRMGGA